MNVCFFLDARPFMELMGQDDKLEQICTKLDKERREKLLHQVKPCQARRAMRMAMVENLGAGLLLQYAVAWVLEQGTMSGRIERDEGAENAVITVTCEQLLADSYQVSSFTFCYGAKGKPYFADIPLFFSLSHSEGRVICAVSETEIGADLQYPRELDAEKLAERFFSLEERTDWSKLAPKERQKYFYRCWTRKEAYGKLTGEGVAAYIGRNVMGEDVGELRWQEYIHDGGYVAICRRQGESNKGVVERE